MNKSELIQKCKQLKIKGYSSKNKNELILMIQEKEKQEQEQEQNNIEEEELKENVDVIQNKLTNVLKELIIKIPKDKQRKVCKICNELGHNINSISCKVNIDKNNKFKQKIKNYILSQNCLEDKTIEEHLNYLSNLLDITPNLCRTLYNEIPLVELLNRQININTYLNNLNQLSKKCNECNKKILSIQINTNRIWNGNEVCDYCWSKYDEYRKLIWQQISEYKIIKCEICNRIKQNDSERYHYDHLNMFNKNKSICTMVNEGMNIEQIYSEIDKCQILCLSCHHIVTDIEHKLDFTRIKQTLTKNFNQNEITEEEYIEQTLIYQNIYEEKMKDVYEKLKNHLQLFEIG